jgi:recombination protein RecR
MDGIGPQDLTIQSLLDKIKKETVSEIIFALSATMEADTTNFYIYKLLSPFGVKTSTIALGIPVGDDLEFTDEVTLGRSILARVPFEASISKS